ncbi:MAG: peptidylprolyl isomerase [Halobacteria archaeon]
MSDPEDTESQDETEETEETGLQEGDFIEVEYTATAGEDDDGQVIDTTSEETAVEEGMDTDNRSFGPRVIQLGEQHLFEAVEKEITGEEVGYSDNVVVDPEDAFGEHDPEEVETISKDRIDEDDRYPGAQVTVDGRQGYIETIIGGRARVDFNHPLAGKEVTYEFEVTDEIEDRLKQIEGVIELKAGADVEVSEGTETKEVEEETEEGETEVTEEELDTIYIEAPQELSMNQNWIMMKSQITDEIMHDFDADRVVVRETHDHSEMHGGMAGMGGLGMEELQDMDEEEIEELAEDL